MLPDFEFPVIESYQQLAGVLLTLAIVAAFVRLLLRHRMASRARTARVTRRSGLLRSDAPAAKVAQRAIATPRIEFETLATYIASSNSRAQQIYETQSAAALKLDTVEMAVNRLLADINGIMAVPLIEVVHTPLVATGMSPTQPRASLAA